MEKKLTQHSPGTKNPTPTKNPIFSCSGLSMICLGGDRPALSDDKVLLVEVPLEFIEYSPPCKTIYLIQQALPTKLQSFGIKSASLNVHIHSIFALKGPWSVSALNRAPPTPALYMFHIIRRKRRSPHPLPRLQALQVRGGMWVCGGMC